MKSLIRLNAEKDPSYCPYCLRCSGLVRMKIVEPYYWKCSCGASCDERIDIDEVMSRFESPTAKELLGLMNHLSTKLSQCGENKRDRDAYNKLFGAYKILVGE